MPLYDFSCTECSSVREDVFYSLKDFSVEKSLDCPDCGKVVEHKLILTSPPLVDSWTNGGLGTHFSNVGEKGMTFHSKKQYRDYLKREGQRDMDL